MWNLVIIVNYFLSLISFLNEMSLCLLKWNVTMLVEMNVTMLVETKRHKRKFTMLVEMKCCNACWNETSQCLLKWNITMLVETKHRNACWNETSQCLLKRNVTMLVEMKQIKKFPCAWYFTIIKQTLVGSRNRHE